MRLILRRPRGRVPSVRLPGTRPSSCRARFVRGNDRRWQHQRRGRASSSSQLVPPPLPPSHHQRGLRRGVTPLARQRYNLLLLLLRPLPGFPPLRQWQRHRRTETPQSKIWTTTIPRRHCRWSCWTNLPFLFGILGFRTIKPRPLLPCRLCA